MTKKEFLDFLDENKDLIEDHEFTEFYKKVEYDYTFKDVKIFTQLFIKSGVNPIEYMDSIPRSYCYGNLDIIHLKCNDTIKNIPAVSFKDCTNLKTVVLPKELKCISEAAFENCFSLETVRIPDKTEEIKAQAFCNCKNLKNIYLPKSIKSIGDLAFHIIDSKNITIHYDGSEDDFYNIDRCFHSISKNINIEYNKNSTNPIMEDYPQHAADWFKKYLKMYPHLNDFFLARNIALDKFKWVDVDLSDIKSSKRSLSDNSKMFVIELPYNDIYITGRDNGMSKFYGKDFKYISMKKILDDALNIGYIDLSDPQSLNAQTRLDRKNNMQGSIIRGKGQHRHRDILGYEYDENGWWTDRTKPILDEFRWVDTDKEDKSGYLKDPTRLVRKLNDVNLDTYGDRITAYYNRLVNLKKELSTYTTDLDLNELPSYENNWTSSSSNFANLYKYFYDAVEIYQRMLQDINKILSRPDLKYQEDGIIYLFKGWDGGHGNSSYENSDIERLHKAIRKVEDYLFELKRHRS